MTVIRRTSVFSGLRELPDAAARAFCRRSRTRAQNRSDMPAIESLHLWRNIVQDGRQKIIQTLDKCAPQFFEDFLHQKCFGIRELRLRAQCDRFAFPVEMQMRRRTDHFYE